MFPTEPVPERIGAYQVLRRLGGSGRADVYVGRSEGPLGFHRTVQLKMVRFSLEDDTRIAEELEREASICARLNHPAVLRMIDFFEYDRRLVLVLDHVDGATLDRLLTHLKRRRQPLGDKAIFYIGAQLASALAHAHETTDEEGNLTPVIHRNLHPENIMVSWDGQVRLTGFGLGKILGRSPDTVVGTVKGSPGYMAPEQARGERVTPRADVYGIAVLLWSLLAHQPPPAKEAPKSLTALRPDVPREISGALDAALEANPDKRRISCRELERWLQKVVKPEQAREELREKVLLLRSTRTYVGETQDAARSGRATTQPRRRLHLRGVKKSMRPMSSGPLSQPQPPSSRPEVLRSSRAPGPESAAPGTTERPMPDLRLPPPPAFGSAMPPQRMESTEPAPPSHRPATSSAPTQVRSFVHTASSRPAPAGASQPPPSNPLPPSPVERGPDSDGVNKPASMAPPPGAIRAPNSYMPSPMNAPPALEPVAGAHGAAMAPPPAVGPRPLSTGESIGVAALTAGFIVGVGIILLERDAIFGGTEKATATTTTAQPAIAPPSPPPAPTAPPKPTAELKPAPPPPDGRNLPGGYGYLTVNSPVDADVYLHGKRAGRSNEPLEVLCGRWFLRLATPNPGRYPAWIGPGESVVVGCQTTTVMKVDPGPPPRQP